MLLDKSDLPIVAIDEMNRTHQNEIDVINKLHVLIIAHGAGEDNETRLGAAIEQFETGVEEHFSREEALMEQSGFPAYAVHKGEHDRVRAELRPIFEAWHSDKDLAPLRDYLENTHPGWAKNHIATMDMMTATFIKQTRSV